MEDDHRALSLKNKFISSLCSSCCFRSGSEHREALEPDDKPRLIKASSSWLRSRAHELPELKEKCRSLFYRIGKGRKHSTDFRYDPLSYALNFDEGVTDGAQADEFLLRNFSARLPPSPPPPVVLPSQTAVFSREITACS